MADFQINSSSLGNALTSLLTAEDIEPGEGRFYVYVYFRPNGVPCYIGKGRGRRWLEHERMADHYNRHLAAIIKKAGGRVPKIKIVEGLTDDQAIKIEIGLIALLGRHPNGPLVNLTDGGDGKRGYVTPDAVRSKIRIANTGRQMSTETRLRMSAARKGKPKTAAHNAAVSMSLKGRTISDATKAAMRESSARRWARPEEKQRLRDYHASMDSAAKAERSAKISIATRSAMADATVRAKISEARRSR